MGTSTLMALGARAMFASYAQLQTTGHNIANANVAGYSRQQAELATASGQFTGAGFFGKGVDVVAVTRSHNAFLTREAATAGSLAALDQTRLDQLSRLEAVFPTGENGIGHAAGQFLNAMVDLASRPQDLATRQVVLARANELVGRFNQAGQQLDSLQNGVAEDLKHSVAQVNTLAKSIADLNQQIAVAQGNGHAPNDLLDQRECQIAELGGLVQVTTIPASDGTLGVFIAGGQRLVLGNQASQMALMPDANDSSRSAIGVVESGGTRSLPSSLLGGGSIAGLLQFQNEDLAMARNNLGRMAVAIATQVNQQQAMGLDLRTPAAAGAPIFGLAAPQALPATSNARDASGNFIASVSMVMADATQLMASEYDLRADPAAAGQYLLTRRSDGLVRSINSGDTVDGLTINVGTPAPAATDRFLLQPVTRAANGLQRVLDDPRALAAASPVVASATLGNNGSASVASLAVVSAAVNPQHTASINFTSSTGDYTWELRDRTSNALIGSGTATWQPGQPIALNGFELKLAGVPASGDGFTVQRTTDPASNNGNALAMAALRDAAMVGGDTITDAYAGVMAGIGVRVQGARVASEMSTRVAIDAETQRASKSGVSLDEEAARLLQFQQAYQAAAKVLQVAQSVFDTLLQAAAR